jgi:hypothetical protein
MAGDRLLLRDIGPYGIIFTNVYVVITVDMVMFRNFGPYGLIFNLCDYYFLFCSHSWRDIYYYTYNFDNNLFIFVSHA